MTGASTPSIRPVALTREPSTSLVNCELSFIERRPIDLARARLQHAAYRAALAEAGLDVVLLPRLDELPDAAVVEDAAVVVGECAVLGQFGVASRAAESDAMAATLADYCPVRHLAPDAILEGGDVLRIGRTLYVGRSARTNDAAIRELPTHLAPFGYEVTPVSVHECLHLKTGCTCLGHSTVLLNPEWVERAPFEAKGLQVLTVDPAEPWAANTLLADATLLVPAGNPATYDRIQRSGFRPRELDISEFEKAEAGLTCLSLLVSRQDSACPA